MTKLAAKKPPAVPHSIWTNPLYFVACGFGVGAMPVIPGTFGTAVGVLLYLMIFHFPLWLYLFVTVLCLLAGVILCEKTNRGFATDDHPAVVWDEIAAFLIVMIVIPPTWYYILIGFVLFRFFDILKPWPIGWIDRNVHGGFGVMLDDVVAALFSWIILYIITFILS